jgi:GMP synthase (glutamine-hydrolysing)
LSTQPEPQITVLDAGGQYAHLIARRVREFGVYAEVRASHTDAAELASRRGVIISGGPASVYEPGSPTVDPALFDAGIGVLGICYGQQLMAHLMPGGGVRKGERGEYGSAVLRRVGDAPLFSGLGATERVWMSHRDQVERLPPGFQLLGSTDTCAAAAIGDATRRLYGVQFHPEVVHTPNGSRLLRNFVFDVCGCVADWDPRSRIGKLEDEIRATVGDRHVFFFVSGGVDSSVAYRLCLRALGPDRVRGAYVDTGLMREGETDFVRAALGVDVVDARSEFLAALDGVVDPERKRHIIGEQFVAVQDRVLRSGDYLDGDWILGQGTIYPDTIESGGTAKSDLIKTHHNRVAGIQELMAAGRIIEPLTSFYKDEVREVGRELGLPDELLDRHPFPGPGLAIRLLCSDEEAPVEPLEDGWLLPVHSVGVQGDSRSYRPVLAYDAAPSDHLLERATEAVNRISRVNRVVAHVAGHAPVSRQRVRRAQLDRPRLERLRRADSIVRGQSHESGFDREVWQFPVALVPCGVEDRPDSVVLRPIHSVDGMTARSVVMPPELSARMAAALMDVPGVCSVYYDLTHKPPGTIEWE